MINPDKGTEITKNAVIIQPNIDPYNDKFREGTFETQLKTLVKLTRENIDKNTVLVVWPETAISVSLNEADINAEPLIAYIRQLLKEHPNAKIVSGLDSYHFFKPNDTLTATARKYEDRYYDQYNSAIMLDTSFYFKIYHKSKLVPGVEKMPYPKFFKFLEKMTINLGGANGSLGEQKEASVFEVSKDVRIAPIICYESVFGDYVGDYIEKGANVLTIMTNDGWWGNTDGYKQHLYYAVLRAIEFRKFIIRSANTGISCYIDASGNIIKPTKFWVQAGLKQNIQINNRQTFYAKHGDYLAKIGSLLALVFILIWIQNRISEKRTKLK